MSIFNVFDIAGSAMSAQSLRLNVTASNLANADSVSSSVDETYRARQPVFKTLMDQFANNGATGGVQVAGIVESKAPLEQRYAPDNPMADENGNVYVPNVNVIDEMTNMISASRSYQTNVEVVETGKQLLLKTLALGK